MYRVVAVLTLTVCLCVSNASAKDPKPGLIPPDASSTMVEFQRAVRSDDWTRALACCTEAVRKAAAGYDRAEAYFRTIMPLDEVLELERFPYCRVLTSPDGHDEYDCIVEREVNWSCTLKKDESGWHIDLPTKTLAQHDADERARLERERREYEIQRAEWEKKLKHMKTRLSAPVGTEFAVSDFIPFRLELINEGEEIIAYSDSLVRFSGSMTITDDRGQVLPYAGGSAQGTVFPTPIRPGQTVVLFDNLDISQQYALNKPGTYRVQFNGKGLRLGHFPDALPSNVVEIRVIEGEPVFSQGSVRFGS